LKNKKNPETTKKIIQVRNIAIATSIVIAAILLLVSIGTGSDIVADKDIRNWVSLVIEGAVAIFVTITVVIYSNYQQDKISQIIFKQNEDANARKKFAISEVRSNLEGAKRVIVEIKNLNAIIASGNTSTHPNIQNDLVVLTRALRRGFTSNKNILITFTSAFTPDQIKEIDLISFEGIQYCDPEQEGTIKQTLPNLQSEIDDLLKILPIEA